MLLSVHRKRSDPCKLFILCADYGQSGCKQKTATVHQTASTKSASTHVSLKTSELFVLWHMTSLTVCSVLNPIALKLWSEGLKLGFMAVMQVQDQEVLNGILVCFAVCVKRI